MRIPRLWVVAVCHVAVASPATAVTAPTQTAVICEVNQSDRPQHSFADRDGKGKWKEYEALDNLQLNDNGGKAALVWPGADGKVLVSTEEPGEDFYIYTDYCFDTKGQLVQLRFEVRTAWGWAYEEEGPVLKGTLRPTKSEFVGTETGARVEHPMNSEAIPKALTPKLYPRKSKLPFFKLLSK